LQTALQFYELKHGRGGGNVLEEDGVAVRREMEALEKVNEKLNIELERRGEQLLRVEEQLSAVSDKLGRM
jgi:vacuolar-type H+-ATPase subunit I/STV1